jgi:hypothetical protein
MEPDDDRQRSSGPGIQIQGSGSATAEDDVQPLPACRRRVEDEVGAAVAIEIAGGGNRLQSSSGRVDPESLTAGPLEAHRSERPPSEDDGREHARTGVGHEEKVVSTVLVEITGARRSVAGPAGDGEACTN